MRIFDIIGILFALLAVIVLIGHFTHGINFSLSLIIASLGALLRAYFGTKYNEQDLSEINFKHAKKYLKNPIPVHFYIEKHQISYEEVKALINSGKISAWGGIEKESIFIDEI